MRKMLIAATTASMLGAAASIAAAQTVDRYGSQASYAPPVTARPTPTRVLTWPGKTMPQAPQAQAAPVQAPAQPQLQPAAWGAYPSIQGAYAPPTPQTQPQSQPQPGAPQPIARAAAPQGPPVSVAPQAFYPPQVLYYPQAYQTLTGQPAAFAPPVPPVQSQFQPAPTAPIPPAPPQPEAQPQPQGLPTSIYQAPTPSAAAEPARTTQLAALDAPSGARAPQGQGVRTYSIHRPFGKTPDPVPTPPSGFDQAALLVPTEDAPNAADDEGLGLRSMADAKD